MHMVWLNLIPQLVDLWTNNFNDIGEGQEEYQLHPNVWQAVSTSAADSGDTIPSEFGCRVPSFEKRSHFIAESWSIWALQLSPHLLRRRFRRDRYYIHFVKLVKLLHICVQFDLSRSELEALREGFGKWVQEYERIYYQHDPSRLQTCPVNMHYLLHVAECIESMGPLWCYWAFPMERFCSYLGASVRNRRFPYVNIARRIRDTMTLKIIRESYDLHKDPDLSVSVERSPDCLSECECFTFFSGAIYLRLKLILDPHALLLTPRYEVQVTNPLLLKITKYLITSFGISPSDAKAYVPKVVPAWGRVRIANGGDLIRAAGSKEHQPGERDMTFVRYELLHDRNAHLRNAPEDHVQKSCYGQLIHLFAVALGAHTAANDTASDRVLLLALIEEAKTIEDRAYGYVVRSFGRFCGQEVVDARAVQCVVGRVFDRNAWWILDRSSELAQPEFM
ncbi:hypothetical protein BDV93DRAFT_533718 [Ceratobasidium sp. AG-I]|nr:hypothetical protein BDV93DRAFT_533718 [Ceratobasidium sp. AG-I]